nr:hypothetical protein [Tanacetum cinerariifolium]
GRVEGVRYEVLTAPALVQEVADVLDVKRNLDGVAGGHYAGFVGFHFAELGLHHEAHVGLVVPRLVVVHPREGRAGGVRQHRGEVARETLREGFVEVNRGHNAVTQVEVGVSQAGVVHVQGRVQLPVRLGRVADTVTDVFAHAVGVGSRQVEVVTHRFAQRAGELVAVALVGVGEQVGVREIRVHLGARVEGRLRGALTEVGSVVVELGKKYIRVAVEQVFGARPGAGWLRRGSLLDVVQIHRVVVHAVVVERVAQPGKRNAAREQARAAAHYYRLVALHRMPGVIFRRSLTDHWSCKYAEYKFTLNEADGLL